MSLSRTAVAVTVALISAAGACTFDPATPADAVLTCESDSDCPAGHCARGRCFAPSTDNEAPTLTDLALTPAVRPGEAVSLSFHASERLAIVEAFATLGGESRFFAGARSPLTLRTRADDGDETASVTLRVVDEHGNQAEVVAGSFALDGTAPSLASVSLTPEVARAGSLVELTVIAAETLGADPVLRFAEDADPGFAIASRDGPRATFTVLVPATAPDDEAILAGVHLTDVAGNESDASAPAALHIDNTPPLFATVSVSPTLASAQPGYADVAVDIALETPAVAIDVTADARPLACDALEADGLAIHCDLVVDDSFANGPVSIVATARDAVGNIASDGATLSVDRTPPSVVASRLFVSTLNDTLRGIDPVLTKVGPETLLTAFASFDEPLQDLTFTFAGQQLVAEGDQWSLDISTLAPFPPDGPARVDVVAVDQAGNTLELALPIDVDTRAPLRGDGPLIQRRALWGDLDSGAPSFYVVASSGAFDEDGLVLVHPAGPADFTLLGSAFYSAADGAQLELAGDVAQVEIVLVDHAGNVSLEAAVPQTWVAALGSELFTNPHAARAVAVARTGVAPVTAPSVANALATVDAIEAAAFGGAQFVRAARTLLVPGARTGARAVGDPVRGRVVMFGGIVEGTLALSNETWALSADQWSLLEGAAPRGRTEPMLAYDAANDVVVLAGGSDPFFGLPQTDVWTLSSDGWYELALRLPDSGSVESRALVSSLDGGVWLVSANGVERVDVRGGTLTLEAPPPTDNMAGPLTAAPDFAGNRLVVASRADGTTQVLQDGVWITVEALSPIVGPCQLTWHAAIERVVAVCTTGAFDLIGDTWVPATGIDPGFSDPAVAFDPGTDRLQLVRTGSDGVTEWWSRHKRWERVAPTTLPFSSQPSFLVTRDMSNDILLVNNNSETHELVGLAWGSSLPSGSGPIANPRVAADAISAIMVGHIGGVADAVVWGAGQWVGAKTPPIDSSQGPIAFDANHGVTALLTDTAMVAYDRIANAWSALPIDARAVDDGDVLVHDAAHQRFVFFDGAQTSVVPDTGGAWSELVQGVSPDPNAAFAYAPNLGAVIAFGGGDQITPLADTWALLDDVWTRLPAVGPAPRAHAGLAANASGDVTMYGGFGQSGSLHSDTWILEARADQRPALEVTFDLRSSRRQSPNGLRVLVSAAEVLELQAWSRAGEWRSYGPLKVGSTAAELDVDTTIVNDVVRVRLLPLAPNGSAGVSVIADALVLEVDYP